MTMNAYGSIGLLGYLFMAWCLWKIARALNVGDEWMAWIPLINLFTLFSRKFRGQTPKFSQNFPDNGNLGDRKFRGQEI